MTYEKASRILWDARDRFERVGNMKIVNAIDTVLKAQGRPTGRWIEGRNPINHDETIYTCSNCGSPGNWDNFCRICGADMNGGEDND